MAEEEQKEAATAAKEPGGENVTGQPAKFAPLQDTAAAGSAQNLNLIMDIHVEISVQLGKTRMLIKDVLELAPGSVIELSKLAGEPVDILINQALIARGEVVVINENFGVRITEIQGAAARIQNLGGKGSKKES